MSRITDRSLYGMVDLLVLKTLSSGEQKHGLSIIDEIRMNSGEEGLLKAEWKISDKRRRAKF